MMVMVLRACGVCGTTGDGERLILCGGGGRLCDVCGRWCSCWRLR